MGFTNGLLTLIESYTLYGLARASQAQTAAQQAATGANLQHLARVGDVGNNLLRANVDILTLELQISQRASASANLLQANGQPLPNQNPTTAPRGAAISSLFLTFGIALNPNHVGFAQTLTYQYKARQTIHQTMIGYYVDEFGLAPGEVQIDAMAVFQDRSGDQITQFVNALYAAKQLVPLSVSTPPVLLLHDNYLNRSFKLTQTDFQVTLSAEQQNLGRVRLQANILEDTAHPINVARGIYFASNPAPGVRALATVTGQYTPNATPAITTDVSKSIL